MIDEVQAWLGAAAEPEPLVVETSGSTGAPKRVRLSRRALVASATATHERLGGPGRWLLTLPPSYVAGLQVVVRSLLAGVRPAVAEGPWAGAAERCRYASLVPTQLHRALTDPAETAALAGLDAVLLGGGPIDPSLRQRAVDAGITVVATYGSSETSGGCVYDGVPLAQVRVETEDDGRVRIAGPVLFDGYDDDPAATSEVLDGGWFRTSDLGRVVDGRLVVLGRLDDVVISGGINVPTPAVARRLREHLCVDAVEVLGVPDEVWGQRVVAFVVGRLDRDAARDWVAAEHPRSWAPREVVELPELPLLANGKVDRVALRALA
ncbi:AMP-binding protein [Nocardioides sp. MJB4]|uniref:AMP-binding protein n=1 Tax=Nocardioides donggukensis TaxID=2774019 RepID=A0A927K6L4_9ACTN|nr:AMP-binding protein [Nocardioides donggukensis]